MVKGGQLNAQGFPFSLLVLDGCSVHFHGETLLQILFCDIFGGLAFAARPVLFIQTVDKYNPYFLQIKLA